MCENCANGEYRYTTPAECIQLTSALLTLINENQIGANLDNEPVAGFMQYLFRSDEALGIVSCVISIVGDQLREHAGKPADFPLYVQRVDFIAAAPGAAAESGDRAGELVSRVQRCIQWINTVWAEDLDHGNALFGVIEAEGPASRASDIAQTLTMIEGVWASHRDPNDDRLSALFA